MHGIIIHQKKYKNCHFSSGEESLLCSVLALYLTRCLSVSGYLDPASSRSNQELELFHLLYLAVLIALRYTRLQTIFLFAIFR